MKFPARIYLKWDREGPYLVETEELKAMAPFAEGAQGQPDEPDLVGIYQLVQEVREWQPIQEAQGRQGTGEAPLTRNFKDKGKTK